MYLRPASWAWATQVASGLARAHAGQLDQHGQVEAGDHLGVGLLHHRDGEVGGRAAEHVGQQDHALAVVDRLRRPCRMSRAAPLHVVVRADADGAHGRLRARPHAPWRETNSSASRPCVTITSPIIDEASTASPVPARPPAAARRRA